MHQTFCGWRFHPDTLGELVLHHTVVPPVLGRRGRIGIKNEGESKRERNKSREGGIGKERKVKMRTPPT